MWFIWVCLGAACSYVYLVSFVHSIFISEAVCRLLCNSKTILSRWLFWYLSWPVNHLIEWQLERYRVEKSNATCIWRWRFASDGNQICESYSHNFELSALTMKPRLLMLTQWLQAVFQWWLCLWTNVIAPCVTFSHFHWSSKLRSSSRQRTAWGVACLLIVILCVLFVMVIVTLSLCSNSKHDHYHHICIVPYLSQQRHRRRTQSGGLQYDFRHVLAWHLLLLLLCCFSFLFIWLRLCKSRVCPTSFLADGNGDRRSKVGVRGCKSRQLCCVAGCHKRQLYQRFVVLCSS